MHAVPIACEQVYAFIFDQSGRVLVQVDQGRYNTPGGKPEKGETFIETLAREAAEESQVRFSYPRQLNCFKEFYLS